MDTQNINEREIDEYQAKLKLECLKYAHRLKMDMTAKEVNEAARLFYAFLMEK